MLNEKKSKFNQSKFQLPDLKLVDNNIYKTELENVVIEVGGSKPPGIKWTDTLFDSDFGFTLSDKSYADGDSFFEKGKISYNKRDLTAEFFTISEPIKKSTLWEPVADLGEMFEFGIFLSKKPPERIIEFTPIGKDILVYPQPKLTRQQIEEGRWQAANIPGSLALYHPWKKNNQFKIGKFGHVSAPWITDFSGHGIWGKWEFDGNKLYIVIPEEFYQKASYPIRIDPQLGRMSEGGDTLILGDYEDNPDFIRGLSVTFPTGGLGNKLVAYVIVNGVVYLKGNVLEGTGPNYLADAWTPRLEPPAIETGWNDLTFGGVPTFTSGSKYTLVAWGNKPQSKGVIDIYYDVAGTDGWSGINYWDINWPAPPVGVPDGNHYSIYVEYDVSYVITASTNGGGSISPEGAVDVLDGNDQGFTITADDHYKIAGALVDGIEVDVPENGIYTFENVTADHSIVALFTPRTKFCLSDTSPERTIDGANPTQTIEDASSNELTIDDASLVRTMEDASPAKTIGHRGEVC